MHHARTALLRGTRLPEPRMTTPPMVVPAEPDGFGLNATVSCARCGTPRKPNMICRTCRTNASLSDEHRAQIAATKLGIPVQDYLDHRRAGEQWCYGCQQWHPAGAVYASTRICAAFARARNARFKQQRQEGTAR